MSRDVSRRHYTEHPLRNLTDVELDAIEQVGTALSSLRSDYADAMNDLGLLAVYEVADREMKQTLDADRAAAQDQANEREAL